MRNVIDSRSVRSFYMAASASLGVLEARTPRPRRFGADADAMWRALGGELTAADRLRLLLIDAARTFPAAFSPRWVFELEGLAEDDPFGPDWPDPDGACAADAFLAATRASTADAFRKAIDAWGQDPTPPEAPIPAIVGTDLILAAGAGAMSALLTCFEGRRDLDFSAQVALVVATPGERHLLGIAAALLDAARAPRTIPLRADDGSRRELGLTRVNHTVISARASDTLREAIRRFATEGQG